MASSRRLRDPDGESVKITVHLPSQIERHVRALAARRGIGVSPLVRGWIERELWVAEQMRETVEPFDRAITTRSP
jgi:hypothetical protein